MQKNKSSNNVPQKPNYLITQLPNNPKVVFFGSSKFVIPIIEILQENFDLALVVTTEKSPSDPIISYCKKHKLQYYVVMESIPQQEKMLGRIIKKTKTDIGILASFGAIIPDKILSAFPKGILNVHPSLLPKYRGPTPVQEAILNGDKKTGVTIIKLDEKIDHGPILAQVEEPIFENDTAESLYNRLFKKGSELISSIVQTIELNKSLKESPQDHTRATYTESLTRKDGFINIKNPLTKEKLERMIRAYYPWPGVWGKWQMANGKWRIVKFLPEQKIQVEGGKPMDHKDFLNGYPEAKELIEKLT